MSLSKVRGARTGISRLSDQAPWRGEVHNRVVVSGVRPIRLAGGLPRRGLRMVLAPETDGGTTWGYSVVAVTAVLLYSAAAVVFGRLPRA